VLLCALGGRDRPPVGSVELAPLLDLCRDRPRHPWQTGRTLAENHLVELDEVEEVAPAW